MALLTSGSRLKASSTPFSVGRRIARLSRYVLAISAAGIFATVATAAFGQERKEEPNSFDFPTLTLSTGTVITAYGVLDIGGSYYNNVSNATNTGPRGNIYLAENGVLTVTELGLKGSQDLDRWFGHHAKIIFDIAPGFDAVRLTVFSKAAFLSRNGYAGIASDFGTLTFGRQWNFNDDYINGTFITIGYRLSLFRLTEFSEYSDIHDNTVKYVTPFFGNLAGGAFQAGVYYQWKGDYNTPFNKNNIIEGMARYKSDLWEGVVVFDHETDAAGNTISNMPTMGLSYQLGSVKLRASAGFNFLYPGVTPYFGGAGPISVPFDEHVNVVLVGASWAATPALMISPDFTYRDNLTLHNNTKIFRILADYTINKYLDFYTQIGYEINSGGAAESFYSSGAASYLGSGYPNQTQFAFTNGFRFKF